MENVKIIGCGYAYGSNCVTNDMLKNVVDTSDEWIQSRTGIKQRTVSENENTSDLAIRAAKKAIKENHIDKLEFVEVYAIMKKIKFIILEILFLVVMLLCATTTMKILDILFKLSYENTWLVGFKVGFVAWLILSFVLFIAKIKKKSSK